MSSYRIAALTFAFIVLSTIVAPTAQAQPGMRGPGMMGGNFGARGRFAGALYPPLTFHEFARTIPRPFGNSILPYFSLYPPVYYSHSVPRPYGYSPFALPPGMMPAEGVVEVEEVPTSKEITNPFYVPEQDAESSNEEVAVTAETSQMIFNPFVDQPGRAIPQRLVSRVIDNKLAD